MYTTAAEVFVYYFFPLLVLAVGLFGNICGLIVLRGKKLHKIGPLLMHRVLYVLDLCFLLGIFVLYLSKGFQLSLYLISDLSCKLYYYIAGCSKLLSPLLLVYISIDRFISIRYENRRSLLKKNTYQIIHMISVFVITFVCYTTYLFAYELYETPQNVTICYYLGSSSYHIIYVDLSFLFFIFSLMLLFTCFLVYFVFTSHNRVLSNYTAAQNKYFKKDLRLSVTSISFNLLYILLYLPACVVFYFYSNLNEIYVTAAVYIAFLNYSTNFYVMIVSNSAFRKRFKKLFCIKHRQTNGQPQEQQHQQLPIQLAVKFQTNTQMEDATPDGGNVTIQGVAY